MVQILSLNQNSHQNNVNRKKSFLSTESDTMIV